MSAKFTPGPWHVSECVGGGDNRFQVFGSDADDLFQPLTFHGSPLALATEANARLIAAAPDLLAALQLARDEVAGLPHSLGYAFTHLPKIDAAIQKATGAHP